MGGKALIVFAVGFAVISAITALNLKRVAATSSTNSSGYVATRTANSKAKSGMLQALMALQKDNGHRAPITQQFNNGTSGSFTTTFYDSISPYVQVRTVASHPHPVSGMVYDTVDAIVTVNPMNSFSLFSWMTNNENGVYWITGDTVLGRTHTNGQILVSGTPYFQQIVTTAGGFQYNPGSGTNWGIYAGGYNAHADSVRFPTDLSALSTAAGSAGRTYNQEVWITLNPGNGASGNGTAEIRTSANGSPIEVVSISGSFNGVILGTGRVHVQGTLDGALTIASLSDIYVENDITYAKNPKNIHNSTDVLGLVAENNVIVADNTANNSGCTIQASIFTRNGSFTAQNYASRPVAGYLSVYGSIVQNIRGSIGTHNKNTNQVVSGFLKNYTYDSRLSNNNFRPPTYPGFYSNKLVVADWRNSMVTADRGTRVNSKKIKLGH